MEGKKALLPQELRIALVNKIARKCFLPQENDSQPRIIQTTIDCPLCGMCLKVNLSSNSYDVICEKHGSLASARGI